MPSKMVVLFALLFSLNSVAMDLDWHGQFRAETNWLWGYSHGQLQAATPTTDQGYFIPLDGSSPASFQNLFLRLDPRAIVNDNITINTDMWVGTPDRGFMGGDLTSQGKVYSTRTGTAQITMNEFYSEIASDFGTFRIGRVPLNWGLGLVWNNTHALFDRLPSTGDAIGLTTKFGAFKFMPSIVKYRLGSNLGGTLNTAPANTTSDGWSGASDYTLGLTYDNPDEQLDAGLLFMRRVSGANANVINPLSVTTGVTAPGIGSYAYNIWDFYLKKKASIFTVAVEVPLVSGQVQGVNYSTVAGAVDIQAQLNDRWTLKIDAGQADGQGDLSAGENVSKVTAFYFHPDYRPGLIMFNYNRRNFSNTAAGSPYDDPVSNARFVSLGVDYSIGKWGYGLKGISASALQRADGIAGNAYFNRWDGYFRTVNAGATEQGSGLGFELDWDMSYQWDEALRFGIETGLLFPGSYYEFSNSSVTNAQKTVFAMALNMSVKF